MAKNDNRNSKSYINSSIRNSTIPKTKKHRNVGSKHDALIKFLLMSQVLTAAVIQNLPETPEIGMTKQRFTNSNKQVYPELESNNTMNVVSGLYGKSINSNSNNESTLQNISSMLDKQMELAQKLDITKSDIDNASQKLTSLIKKSRKYNNQQIKSRSLSTRAHFTAKSRLSKRSTQTHKYR